MNNDPIQPEPSPDFVTVTVDSAYLRLMDGIMCIQFYRDTTFPRINKGGVPIFDNVEREILHETRMSFSTASTLLKNMRDVLSIHKRYVDSEGIDLGAEETGVFWQVASKLGSEPEKVASMFAAERIMTKLLELFSGASTDARSLISDLLEEVLQDNTAEIEAIKEKYPIEVEKEVKEK
jgi:hypothetical protein